MASSGRRASAVRGHSERRRPGSRWPPTRATGSATSSIGRTARRRRGGAKAAAGGRAEEAVSWRPSSTGSNSEGGSTMKAWRALTMLLALRSEEHTSELQSLAYLVCRLLLEKKKKN